MQSWSEKSKQLLLKKHKHPAFGFLKIRFYSVPHPKPTLRGAHPHRRLAIGQLKASAESTVLLQEPCRTSSNYVSRPIGITAAVFRSHLFFYIYTHLYTFYK